MSTVLIIVDAQTDFVRHLDQRIFTNIMKLIDKVDVVIATQSQHPPDHFSFPELGPHCVKGSLGARLNPDIKDAADYTPTRGTRKKAPDDYSAFDASTLRPLESVEEILKNDKIDDVWICGYGHGWDVPQTAYDANALGYRTSIWWRASRSFKVEVFPQLENAGIALPGEINE